VHDLTGARVRKRGHDTTPATDQQVAPGTVARLVRVRGRVQGVYFRSSTRQTARRHGVTGWVRNVEDGSVEAWLEGEPGAVDDVETWMLAGGPPAAEVVDAEVRSAEPEGHARFEVRR
jgi:acylphosphatase